MTSTQHPDRLDAARRIFEERHPRFTFDHAVHDGRDVRIYFFPRTPGGEPGTATSYLWIDADDIDLELVINAEEAEAPSLVERLRSHGLPTEPTRDGGAILTLTAVQALALANALDRLEGRS